MAHIDDLSTQKANLKFIKNSMAEPLLEKDYELKLARRWKYKKDESALHELTRSYMRLVVAVASKYKHYGLPLGDLIQEGNIGLMEAALRFKPSLKFRFSTYANWWIRAAIQDYILRNWSIVRTGTTAAQKALFFNLRRLRAQIDGQSAREYMDEKSIKSIAKELKVKESDVKKMEARLTVGDQSLNNTISTDTTNEWQDFIRDQSPSPEEMVEDREEHTTCHKWLLVAMKTLSEREQKIIQKRRLEDDPITLEALGKELKISKERVRQLEQRAMQKLKASIVQQIEKEDRFTQDEYLHS